MKVDDLVQRINVRTGFKANKDDSEKCIYIGTSSDDSLMMIKYDVCYLADISVTYYSLDACGKRGNLGNLYALLNLINEFVNTPLKERFPEKKYVLKATRYYIGPIPETHYITGFESCADYSKVKYGNKKEFTQTELENIERNDPALKPFIDATKELVEDKNDETN